VSNLGIAFSEAEIPLGDEAAEEDIKVVSTVEVRRGMGSSGFEDWAKSGRNGL
jgi:hypothetical protein